jgi:hypothetical protein
MRQVRLGDKFGVHFELLAPMQINVNCSELFRNVDTWLKGAPGDLLQVQHDKHWYISIEGECEETCKLRDAG